MAAIIEGFPSCADSSILVCLPSSPTDCSSTDSQQLHKETKMQLLKEYVDTIDLSCPGPVKAGLLINHSFIEGVRRRNVITAWPVLVRIKLFVGEIMVCVHVVGMWWMLNPEMWLLSNALIVYKNLHHPCPGHHKGLSPIQF